MDLALEFSLIATLDNFVEIYVKAVSIEATSREIFMYTYIMNASNLWGG